MIVRFTMIERARLRWWSWRLSRRARHSVTCGLMPCALCEARRRWRDAAIITGASLAWGYILGALLRRLLVTWGLL